MKVILCTVFFEKNKQADSWSPVSIGNADMLPAGGLFGSAYDNATDTFYVWTGNTSITDPVGKLIAFSWCAPPHLAFHLSSLFFLLSSLFSSSRSISLHRSIAPSRSSLHLSLLIALCAPHLSLFLFFFLYTAARTALMG